MTILVLFIIWQALIFLVSYLAPYSFPYLGFFPYKEILLNYNLPKFIYSLANFDGTHYVLIAKQGYMQYEQAFFPAYPMLIRLASRVFSNNHIVTGIIISSLFFILGLRVFRKYLEMITKGKGTPLWTIIFLLAFPTSFYFGTVYTEGLFFFLLVTSLFYLEKEDYPKAAIFGFLTSLTRLAGVFLIIPFAIKMFARIKKNGKNISVTRHILRITCLSAPLFGLLSYCLYLWKTTGDPVFFFNSQPAFGANRSTHLILLPQVYFRYIKIFITASWNFQYFVSALEFMVFTLVLIVLLMDLIKTVKNQSIKSTRLALNLFSLANILLPTLTGTFSSIPRYALVSLSFFIALSEINNKIIKSIITFIFLFLNIIIFSLFVQGYFVS